MGFAKSQFAFFLITVLVPLLSSGQEVTPQNVDLLPAIPNCATPTPWSDVTYEDLRMKLEETLKEKNKSLISLDFKSLQAQVDVAVNHLLTQDGLSNEDYIDLLKKNLAYLEELEKLMNTAKESTRLVKEGYVVPLAALTSIKAESDKCLGNDSQYLHIFQTLSQLNKDFNEILMMSPQKLIVQKEKVRRLLDQLEDGKIKLTVKEATEHLNFIQMQINAVTSAFEFDSRILQVASH
jgi:hypothetical protein